MSQTEKRQMLRAGKRERGDLTSDSSQFMVRYFGHPLRIHVDADGVLNSQFFKKYEGNRHSVIYPCAGEAHWQTGLIERHIQTHKRTHQQLALEEQFSQLSTQEVLDAASTTKNTHGQYGGYSPFQWITGNNLQTSIGRRTVHQTSCIHWR